MTPSYTTSCLDKALQKANMHIFLPAADCTGDRMAPRRALMPLVIICNTQLSLESYKTAARTFQGAAGV